MRRMRQLREASGLTLAELAEQTGINPFTLGRYERGTQAPSVDRGLLVARALGVSLDYLAGEDSRPEAGTAEERRVELADDNRPTPTASRR